MIRVLIADDHALLRRGLRQLIESIPDLQVVGEVVTGDDVLAAVLEMSPDILLLDVSMPGAGFLTIMDNLRARIPRVRTLVVSAHAEPVYARRALRAGAAGYVSKGSAEQELVAAIRIAARGGRYVSPALAQELAADVTANGISTNPHESLSPREYEVMLLLASGQNVTAIAAQLHLSVKTVSTHRTRLLAKMNMRSTAELVRYALAHGLMGEG